MGSESRGKQNMPDQRKFDIKMNVQNRILITLPPIAYFGAAGIAPVNSADSANFATL